MWYFKFYEWPSSLLHFLKGKRTSIVFLIFCVVMVSGILTACGTATGQVQHLAKTPTPTLAPTPTIRPTVAPTPTAVPTHSPSAPAILDLQPASMSLLGHRDCQKTTAYICQARVLSRASNQSNLNWTAYTDVPGNIVFSPSSGSLLPGQSIIVTITVPLNACTLGLFYFRGPINTHTITWAC